MSLLPLEISSFVVVIATQQRQELKLELSTRGFFLAQYTPCQLAQYFLGAKSFAVSFDDIYLLCNSPPIHPASQAARQRTPPSAAGALRHQTSAVQQHMGELAQEAGLDHLKNFHFVTSQLLAVKLRRAAARRRRTAAATAAVTSQAEIPRSLSSFLVKAAAAAAAAVAAVQAPFLQL